MSNEVVWVANGKVSPPPTGEAEPRAIEEHALQLQGMAKLVLGHDGTEIKWSVFSPNWASLFHILESLDYYPPPFKLKFFLMGWLEEDLDTVREARDRVSIIQAKSDIHLTQRTFVREADPLRKDIPPLLKNALKDREVLPDFSIDCVLDEVHKKFRVGRIGSETPIAKVYGFHPVSYPCINGLSYDHLVSEAYGKVVATGQPHYDHVIAAMTTPDGSVVWFPYQRVILPHHLPDGRKGVSVVSQVARVDIKIV